ncbi:hypothetical protein NDU88_003476 [Pleurodeles waltl]|uniref:Uncharacterized protein n=1 Tax=Pleurodeles waltl TaxID=8319 RepID=A0AAV7T5G7_PLEWA|nr:hypothetical protein NDU88_003476 [Pleurodeles waltl]
MGGPVGKVRDLPLGCRTLKVERPGSRAWTDPPAPVEEARKESDRGEPGYRRRTRRRVNETIGCPWDSELLPSLCKKTQRTPHDPRHLTAR